MKILYVAGREATYSRTRLVMQSLQNQGHEVIAVLPPDKAFRHYPGLIARTVLNAPSCDLIVVGFYGQLLIPLIRLLTWKPILFDMYVSTYDTMVHDRQVAKAGSFKARLYAWSDWLAYHSATCSILDTHHMIRHFGQSIGSATDKLRRVFFAADETIIHPRSPRSPDGQFVVHFHGEFIPFHGVRHILQAAALLKAQDVRFQIVGRGLTYESDRQLARELGLDHVTFIDSVPYAELATHMARADVCLGIFGDNARADLVLTNKVIEAIGMGKPLITRRNEPVQELLKHRESVYLVEAANAQAIADAILALKNDPDLRQRIASGGHEVFQTECTQTRFADQLGDLIQAITGTPGRR